MYEIIEQPAIDDLNFRSLSPEEIASLVAQGNSASNWSDVRVAKDGFNAELIHRCGFDGPVLIGATTENYSCSGNFTLKTGLYGSFFRNTYIGNNAAIHNLLYCYEQNIGDSVIISNVCEISYCKNALLGMLVNANDKDNYHPIEVINENGGRAILPCPYMVCADAFIWSKFRGDKELMDRLSKITFKSNYQIRPPKAIIADGAAITNVKAVRDSLIGSSAVIDGAEIIANSTILSDSSEKTVIGAAVQIRDSIIGYGNNINSAAQLDRVITGTAASLEKTARVTHSFIGDSSHISCCEIANSLVMPFHGQHHNNSFLIATAIGGQSNIAAGATIGSNHNSRAKDGEIWAKRGFWPGLCVSLKHNSRFASFTMIAKGSYPAELNVKLPFSLIARDEKNDSTLIFPAFWFTRNMYAVMSCAHKFVNRDNRVHREQFVEHDILAPDTVDEIFEALRLLDNKETLNMEKNRPEIVIQNISEAYKMYRLMIRHYCAKNILPYMRINELKSFDDFTRCVGQPPQNREIWLNCGGTIITESALSNIINAIKKGVYVKNDDTSTVIDTWADIHALMKSWTSTAYSTAKIFHALQSLANLENIDVAHLTQNHFSSFLQMVPKDCAMISEQTLASRRKDFNDPYRAITYDSAEEKNGVLGEINDDTVIKQVNKDMEKLTLMAGKILQ